MSVRVTSSASLLATSTSGWALSDDVDGGTVDVEDDHRRASVEKVCHQTVSDLAHPGDRRAPTGEVVRAPAVLGAGADAAEDAESREQ